MLPGILPAHDPMWNGHELLAVSSGLYLCGSINSLLHFSIDWGHSAWTPKTYCKARFAHSWAFQWSQKFQKNVSTTSGLWGQTSPQILSLFLAIAGLIIKVYNLSQSYCCEPCRTQLMWKPLWRGSYVKAIQYQQSCPWHLQMIYCGTCFAW